MWTKEQEMAINKKGSNILVSASAGSGKTAILVERVIKTCLEEKVDIDKLLVVTFTNASATELKERLMSAIYDELKKDNKNKFLKRQLNLINRANITTIHAFCLNLIRSNFYNLNIDPSFRVSDDVEAKLLKAKAIDKVIEEKYKEYNLMMEKEEDSRKINFSDILEFFGQNEEMMISEILKLYNYSLSFPYPLEYIKKSIEMYNISDKDADLSQFEFGRNIILDTVGDLNILKKRCEKFLDDIRDEEDFEKYVEVLEEDVSILDRAITKKYISWDELYNFLNSASFKNNPRYKGTNEELKSGLMYFRNRVLKDSISKMSQSIYASSKDILKQNRVAYEYLIYIYDIIVNLDEEYKKLKNKKNIIDFSDIEHLALKLLVEKNESGEIQISEVAENLKENFHEIYTDEYQDTSYVQEAILNAIAGTKNRFMVGDIKQSIYKFRQAMPDIFNEKYIKYKKLENLEDELDECKIILDKNFRSRKNVLDSINYIFEKIMSMKTGDCNYSKEETLKAGNESFKDFEGQDYLTEINILDLKPEEKAQDASEVDNFIEERENFELEAMAIASKIKELKENFKVYDLKKKQFRSASYKDIVVLLRSTKDKSSVLEKVFKEKNIPAFSDASNSLLDSDEVRLVISFLKVLDNPLQDIYLASIMYSIIGKFSLDELVKIRGNDKKINLYFNVLKCKESLEERKEISEKEERLLNKINDFLNLLDKFSSYKFIFNISELLTRIYKETSIYYEFAMEENASIKKANLNMLIDIAINFEKNETRTLAAYIDYIDNMKDKTDLLLAAKTIGENEDVVRIMTIHKSKGLEFPIVILADTSKKYNFKDKSSVIIMHHKLGVGINVVNKEKAITYPSVIKKAVANAIDSETRSEELRMLYVALTRAKEKLIIFSSVKDYSKFKEKELVLYENDKIDPYLVSKNSSYFQNIHMCLKDLEEGLFNVNLIKVESLTSAEESDSQNTLLELESLNLDAVDISDVKEALDYEYKFKEYTKAERRVSVTSLKEAGNEDDSENTFEAEKDAEYIKTKYSADRLFSEEKMTGAKRGTLTHFVMEHLDFNIKSETQLDEFLSGLAKKGIMSEGELKSVNKKHIIYFLNTKLAEKIRNSTYVRREEEFIFKDESISLSQIQGIIDLYFLNENGNFEVVDFKTDRLESASDFVERYKLQLDLYAKALKKITGKDVERKCIYSFYLGKEIEV